MSAAVSGRVCHAFASSLYLQDQKGNLVCVGAALARGPLHVPLAANDWAELSSSVNTSTAWDVANGIVKVGPYDIELPPLGKTWRAPTPVVHEAGFARCLSPSALHADPAFAQRSDLLSWVEANVLPEVATGKMSAGPSPQWLRQAIPVVDLFGKWLGEGARGSAHVTALLGLGPGLTPAGDDFIVGALIALRTIGRTTAFDALAAQVGSQLTGSTTTVSAAHLRAACRGEAIEPLHLAAQALVQDGTLGASQLSELGQFGASSGADALAGVITVLKRLR